MSTATATKKRPRISMDLADGQRVSLQGKDGDDDNSMLERLKLAQAALAQKTQQAGQAVTPQYRGMMEQPAPSADPNAVTPQYRQPMGLVQPQVAPQPSVSPLATQLQAATRDLGQGYAKDAAGSVTYQGQPPQQAPAATQPPVSQFDARAEKVAATQSALGVYGWTAPAPAAPPVDPLKAQADALAKQMNVFRRATTGDPDAIAELAASGKLKDPATRAVVLKGMDVKAREAAITSGRELGEKRITSAETQTGARLKTQSDIAEATNTLRKSIADAQQTGLTTRHKEDLTAAKEKLASAEGIADKSVKSRETLAGSLNVLRMEIARMEEVGRNARARQAEQTRLAAAKTGAMARISANPRETPLIKTEDILNPIDWALDQIQPPAAPAAAAPAAPAPPTAAPQAGQGASPLTGQAPAPPPAAGAGAMPGAPQGQPPPMPPYEFQAQVGVVYVNPKGTKLRRTAQGWEIVP
ncbi:MAG: hypothetical protein IMZ62_13050 [Chloroflexi bacterium]|nr:hypothetical protein [Chloroflexota bacterium]